MLRGPPWKPCIYYIDCYRDTGGVIKKIEVKIGEHTILLISYFKYLGSTIQNDGEIEEDVNCMIQIV
jgi:hypothetical protein